METLLIGIEEGVLIEVDLYRKQQIDCLVGSIESNQRERPLVKTMLDQQTPKPIQGGVVDFLDFETFENIVAEQLAKLRVTILHFVDGFLDVIFDQDNVVHSFGFQRMEVTALPV